MKNLFLGAFLFGLCSFQPPSMKDDFKALNAENKALTKRIDSLLYSGRSEIQSRIKKADRLARGAADPASVLPVYQSNCDYCVQTLARHEMLEKSLKDQEALVEQFAKELKADKNMPEAEKKQMGEMLGGLFTENSDNEDKLKEVQKNCESLKKASCKEVERLKKMIEKNK